MRIFYSFEEYWKENAQKNGQKPRAMCIGNFDGVHLGHQALIKKTKELAAELGGLSCVLTFDPHPLEVLQPQVFYNPLFDLSDRLEQFKILGIDEVIVQPFNLAFADLNAEDFLEKFLLKNIRPEHIIVGYNFSFGKKGLGKPEMLKQKMDAVTVVSPVAVHTYVVSTSKIKDFLIDGNVSEARICLGRPYSLKGIVVKGDQRGRQIGFPTANILNPLALNLKKGVYSTYTYIKVNNLWIKYKSITNVGVNPTVSAGMSVKVETNIFNFSEDIYSQEIRVEFINFIRPEKKFTSLTELQEQIRNDVSKAHTYEE